MKKNFNRIISTILCITLLIGLIPLTSHAAAPSSKAVLYTEGTLHEAQTREVLRLVNEERSKVGAAPLVMTDSQEDMAQVRALELIAQFSHTRPNGESCFSIADDFGISYSSAGENIAFGQTNASEVMYSWMNSDGHRQNILNPDFTHIGIGCFEYYGSKYWVQFFTSNPSDTTAAPSNGYDNLGVGGTYEIDTNTVIGSRMAFYNSSDELAIGNALDFDLYFYAPDAWGYEQFIGVVLAEYLDSANGAVTSSRNKVTLNKENQIVTTDQCLPGSDTLTIRIGSLTASKNIDVFCNHNYKDGFCTICGAEKPAIIDVSGGSWRQDRTGWWYALNSGSYLKDCRARIGGSVYLFNRKGYMVTGWVFEDGSWYYYKPSGAMATGWVSVSGKWYYMDRDGIMQTGKQDINGTVYYFNPNGTMVTGWRAEDGNWYYHNASGNMVKGWLKLGSTWYYLDPDTGVMATGIQVIGNATYRFQENGAMVTGWVYEDDTWYYYHTSGAMAKGWFIIGSTWYYCDPDNGRMYANEWLNDIYYFIGNGAMAAGWTYIGENWYYFTGSGNKVCNQWVGNYYVKADGTMAVNEWIGSYYVGADGKWIPNYVA